LGPDKTSEIPLPVGVAIEKSILLNGRLPKISLVFDMSYTNPDLWGNFLTAPEFEK